MSSSPTTARVLAALLCTSCTTILGVDEGVLDETGTTGTTATTTGTGTTSPGATSSTGDGGGDIVSSASTASGDGGGSTGPTTSSAGGSGGDGGSVTVTSGGGGGDGGASTVGSTGTGGDGGGTTATSTAAGSGGGGGGGGGAGGGGAGGGGSGTGGSGGGGGCPLAAVPACPGVQPTSFAVASDLSSSWDVLSPQAEVNAANQLALRILNGSTHARIEAKVALDQPAACGVWVDLRLPSSGAGVASGLAIVGATGTHSIFRLEAELRVRDAAGGVEAIPYDAVDTAMVRARFDAAGDLWLDTSADGACWTAVDGPFVVGDGPLDVQLFVERPGTAGSATSTFDDYTL